MPDFLAIIGPNAPDSAPGVLPEAGLAWTKIGPGWLGIAGKRWTDLGDGWRVTGRPVVRGGGRVDAPRLAGLLGDATPDAFNTLSSMFLLLHALDAALTVVTDRFSHLPAYELEQNRQRFVSSRPEWIAAAAPSTPEIDDVSVAELLLYENVTFPFSTRVGVRQLAPATRHTFKADATADRETLWRPAEPDRWPGKRACIDRAVAAFDEAADEVASTAPSAGVLLSGGLDSRLILAALAPRMDVEAFTFLDRPNRESRAAEAAAEILKVPHHACRRDPEYYAHAFTLGQQTAGFEQHSIPSHGACLAGSEDARRMGVLVSGFGCDILLKGAYIPYGLDTILKRRLGIGGRDAARIGKHNYSHVKKRSELVKPQLVEAALQRRANHEAWLREFRPDTAEEWLGFYPISHTTSVDTMVNARLFPYDEFFFHTGFVEAMRQTPWHLKKNLTVVSALGRRVGGPAARLAHPHTGLPATATYLERRLKTKLGLAKAPPPVGGNPDDPSWYSETSFINYRAYFADSPAWAGLRDEAFADSGSVEALSRIMAVEPASLAQVSGEQDSLVRGTVVQALRLYARAHTPEAP